MEPSPDSGYYKEIEERYPALRDIILRVVNRFPSLKDEKDDIVSNVFISLLKRGSPPENWESYTWGVASNICSSLAKNKGKRPNLPVETVSDSFIKEYFINTFTTEHLDLMSLALEDLKKQKFKCFEALKAYYFGNDSDAKPTDPDPSEVREKKQNTLTKERIRCRDKLKEIILSKRGYEDLKFLVPPSKRK